MDFSSRSSIKGAVGWDWMLLARLHGILERCDRALRCNQGSDSEVTGGMRPFDGSRWESIKKEVSDMARINNLRSIVIGVGIELTRKGDKTPKIDKDNALIQFDYYGSYATYRVYKGARKGERPVESSGQVENIESLERVLKETKLIQSPTNPASPS
jgi:hypothetical protein